MNGHRSGGARLHVDWTRCDGRGLCTELLPRVLTRDQWGYPLSRDGTAEPVLRSEEMGDAFEAVDLCPRLALTLLGD